MTDMHVPPAVMALAETRRKAHLDDLTHRAELLSQSANGIPALSNSADEVFMAQRRMQQQTKDELTVMIADTARLKGDELVRRFCADWVADQEARAAQGQALCKSHDQVIAERSALEYNRVRLTPAERFATPVTVVGNDDWLVVPAEAG